MPTNWTNNRRNPSTGWGNSQMTTNSGNWGTTNSGRGRTTASNRNTENSGSWGTTTTGRTRTTTAGRTTTGGKCAPGYSNIFNSFNQKMQSIKTLCSQTTGTAKWKRPTPTTLNTFANWLNKGCNVCTVSNSQVQKWGNSAGYNFKPNSVTNAKTIICAKFGKNAVKAITCDKNGGFLIACPPTVNGRPFNIAAR